MNEFKVTWKLYRSWAMENMAKGSRLVMMIIWCVYTLICLVFMTIDNSAFRSLYFFMAAFGIYRAFFRNFVIARSQYRRLAQNYGEENWTRRIVFEDNGITLTEGNFSLRYDYSNIINIREKGNKIWLEASNKTVLRLYRDAFVESDWDECKSRLK